MIGNMNRLLPALLNLALFLPTTITAQAMPASAALGIPTEDPFPPGKSLHFLGGMMLGLAAAGIADLAVDPQLAAAHPCMLPLVALSASALGGVAKELLDSTGFGDPRFTDILITTGGGVAAAFAVGWAEGLYPSNHSGRANAASFLLSMAIGASVPVVIGFIGEIRSYLQRRAKETQ
jgi:hypothetical protein